MIIYGKWPPADHPLPLYDEFCHKTVGASSNDFGLIDTILIGITLDIRVFHEITNHDDFETEFQRIVRTIRSFE